MTKRFSLYRHTALFLCLAFCVAASSAKAQTSLTPAAKTQAGTPAKHALKIENHQHKHELPQANMWRWAPNTTVRIFFVKGQFNEAEQQALRAAINDWNNVAHELGTGVSFYYSGETQTVINTDSVLTMTRSNTGQIYPGTLAYFEPLRSSQPGLITSGVINFNLKTHQPSALVSFMAHEMGHGLGLGDCPRCKETVMRFFRGPNQDNGFFSPTDSDKAIIRSLYAGNNTAILTDTTAASAGNR